MQFSKLLVAAFATLSMANPIPDAPSADAMLPPAPWIIIALKAEGYSEDAAAAAAAAVTKRSPDGASADSMLPLPSWVIIALKAEGYSEDAAKAVAEKTADSTFPFQVWLDKRGAPKPDNVMIARSVDEAADMLKARTENGADAALFISYLALLASKAQEQ
ncbi:hypothetical protein QBC34DRAFT_384162 [Podospora aff. communis PSN243]|uniref:Uncharacterized protein n=1 Tax=Podospora aff. communis PSN243 TaxID=3040156 RepID=A0AAV9GBT0_9PEZI|nr:hypothetical protein QBC34DRAFT_384162 [Podospora aff. communis PSN243]